MIVVEVELLYRTVPCEKVGACRALVLTTVGVLQMIVFRKRHIERRDPSVIVRKIEFAAGRVAKRSVLRRTDRTERPGATYLR